MASSWLSVLLGGSLGGGYGLAAYVMSRFALRHRRQRFMALLVGGMLARMIGMLAAVGGAVAFVAVRPVPFVGALVTSLLAGLAVEVFTLYRHANA